MTYMFGREWNIKPALSSFLPPNSAEVRVKGVPGKIFGLSQEQFEQCCQFGVSNVCVLLFRGEKEEIHEVPVGDIQLVG